MSELRTGLADYLVLRRSLGYKLVRASAVLEDFVGFAETRLSCLMCGSGFTS